MEAKLRVVVWVISVFDPQQLGHEVRPLDPAAIPRIVLRNPKDPFPPEIDHQQETKST